MFLPAALWCQPAARPEFEVASVKPSDSDGMGPQRDTRNGNLTAEEMSLKQLVSFAYNVPELLISGPGWMDSSRYDIRAKGNGNAPQSQVRLMLQSLLADRFHLQVHRETKEMSLYYLVPTSGGLKAQSADDPKPTFPKAPEGAPSVLQNWHASMADLAFDLTGLTGRPVTDRTGITGQYRIRLWYARNLGKEGPDVFAALQEECGLKLESGRGPVETLIVDHADKVPTEN